MALTVQECYRRFGGDYEDAVRRLMSEDLICRYLKMFPDDDSFQTLSESLAGGDDRQAFIAAHTLKGLALNLGMTALARSASELTEALRNGKKPEADSLFAKCRADYERTVGAVRELS